MIVLIKDMCMHFMQPAAIRDSLRSKRTRKYEFFFFIVIFVSNYPLSELRAGFLKFKTQCFLFVATCAFDTTPEIVVILLGFRKFRKYFGIIATRLLIRRYQG